MLQAKNLHSHLSAVAQAVVQATHSIFMICTISLRQSQKPDKDCCQNHKVFMWIGWRQTCNLSKLFESKIHKEYLIWNYIQICFCQPVNVFITCLRHAYFSNHIINCLSLKCHLAVTDNSKTVMRRLFVCLFLFWLDNSPFESCNHWSCLLIMFGYVSTRLSRLDTNCHCLHSKYLPTTWP